MSWRGVLTLVLLIGALVSGWSAWRQKDDVDATGTAPMRTDYLLRDFDLVALDSTGVEAFALQAPELQQTPGARTLELTTPFFQVPDENGERWEIRSATGWVSDDNEEVRLRGNVTADSPPGGSRPTKMETEELNVFPQRNQATSDVLVNVLQRGSTMQGIGMRADLETGRIELLSQVKLRNDPTSR
ncbi:MULTISPECIES: LPS export ABC transporter periplasmic protein LptC [Luteimonas]|uniref:LPS export ABC transporter periplasmic protein LptC n=1 Tax=Luteimonas TaxID=83614 RepID=UPI0013046DEC|nr:MULTISPECIES: LPS export ABC transporter periplasmic protein LptC [Luteimonas]